ncbi:MAG: alpha/beta fold hydrolase [Shinella sp.]|nr:alpha/beta fold hydrolase [Shinella sp.]
MTAALSIAENDGSLSMSESGAGIPVLFQHGLGGDRNQVVQAFDDRRFRRITLECRGHGASDFGATRPFSIEMFATDVLAAADRLGIERFVAAGISMGAAIALRLATTVPQRVTGLVLVRPAWAFSPAPPNMAPIREIAALLKSHPPEEARSIFAASPVARRLAEEAPDNLASLLGYFDRLDAGLFADLLGDIAADGPGVAHRDAANLAVPSLVIGNGRDFVHPLATARLIAETIPNAAFLEVPSKTDDKAAHFAALRGAISDFLLSHVNRRDQNP